VTRRLSAHWVPAAAVSLGAWLAVDAYRQTQNGSADAGMWFVIGAAAVSLFAAVGVGRHREQRRMALLMLGWLAVVEGGDARPAFTTSRLAMTIAL
jgi:cytochrome c biogenesis protein CcdA